MNSSHSSISRMPFFARKKKLNTHLKFSKKNKTKIKKFDLTIARSDLIGDKTFYKYTKTDFRGRIYYTTPFLNF